MRNYIILLSSALLIFFSCSEDNSPDDILNFPPNGFTASANTIGLTDAMIDWTAAIDPEGENVYYNIYLNDILVASNINLLTYHAIDLLSNHSYNGRVVAFDNLGLNTTALFNFTTLNTSWEDVSTSDTSINLENISFFTGLRGFTSGVATNLVRTTDAGDNWNISAISGFKDIDFFNATLGYGTGYTGNTMRKTVDGGLTWTDLTPPINNSMFGVYTVDTNTVYFVGTEGKILKSDDAGVTFTELSSGASAIVLRDVFFSTPTNGVIVADDGTVRHSTDGINWSLVATFNSIIFNEVHFIDATTGFAVGSNGTLIKSTDGGSSWTAISLGITDDLKGVHFADTTHGLVVGANGTIFTTQDGGTTWNVQESPSAENFNAVYMRSSIEAIIVGDNGIILKNTNIIY